MKSIVRVFVLSLVATGAYASMHTSVNSSRSMHASVSALPVPMCPPNDPHACYICDYGGCGK